MTDCMNALRGGCVVDTLSTGGRAFIIVGDFNRRRMRYDDYEGDYV